MNTKIITLDEFSPDRIRAMIDIAGDIKADPGQFANKLEGRSLLLLFQKTSTRTRVAFELGMKKLGGAAVFMEWEKSNLAISPIRHEAAFLCRVFDAVMARLLSNNDLLELARAFEGPVINGCCDLYHPSQILADLMTIREVYGSLDTTVCYVGVHNNVTNSLLLACAKLGVRLILVTPEKDELPESVQHVLADPPTDSRGDPLIHETLDLDAAVSRCRFLYTDTWVNMEHFANGSWLRERKKAMLPYQVNRDLVRGRDLFIMHDMPVHPGYEIDEYSVYGEQSVVYRQAENRLYTAQALLLELLSEDELP